MRIGLLFIVFALIFPAGALAEDEPLPEPSVAHHSVFGGGTLFNLGPLRFRENQGELRKPFVWWAYGLHGGYEYSTDNGLLFGLRSGQVVTSVIATEEPQIDDPERDHYGNRFAHIFRVSTTVGKSVKNRSGKTETQFLALLGPTYTWFSDMRMSGFHIGAGLAFTRWFTSFGLYFAFAETFDYQWVRETEKHNKKSLENASAFNFFFNFELGMRVRW